MDGLEFTSKVIEAVAWPGTVVVLVFKFSDRFRDLLGKLTEVTLPGGISGKFETPLKNAEHLAEQLEIDFSSDDGIEFTPDPIALSANPTGVIMESWKELEAMGAELLASTSWPGRDTELARSIHGKDVIKELEARGFVTIKEFELLRELREIRNRAAHSISDRPTPEEATRFVSLVGSLKAAWLVRIAAATPRA